MPCASGALLPRTFQAFCLVRLEKVFVAIKALLLASVEFAFPP